MKTSSVLAFTSLLGATFSSPTSLYNRKRQAPSADMVVTAINKWNNDVGNVNSFLNLAPSQTAGDLQNAAEEALINANDEPTELNVLAGLGDALGSDGQAAVLLLQETFGNVPSSLQAIIDDPGNADLVKVKLQQINSARCCNVLPALDKLWPASANAVGVADQVNLVVPRPNACNDGSTIC
jgi:hypothetical protein